MHDDQSNDAWQIQTSSCKLDSGHHPTTSVDLLQVRSQHCQCCQQVQEAHCQICHSAADSESLFDLQAQVIFKGPVFFFFESSFIVLCGEPYGRQKHNCNYISN
jgi:hypothetical protein